ncbi:MAG: hypothetical protein Q7T57_02865, partial [Dehalococcoidales bacterium]|nr:hypothetical protein [Dehalococcoidales bacterium]
MNISTTHYTNTMQARMHASSIVRQRSTIAASARIVALRNNATPTIQQRLLSTTAAQCYTAITPRYTPSFSLNRAAFTTSLCFSNQIRTLTTTSTAAAAAA